MKVFTYSEARQNLSRLLSMAQDEEVLIRRRDGSIFSLKSKRSTAKSPFEVPGVNTSVTSEDILDAIKASRQR